MGSVFYTQAGSGILHTRSSWAFLEGYFAYSVLGGRLCLPWSNCPFYLLTKTLGSQFHIAVRGVLFHAPSTFPPPTRPQVHQSLRWLPIRSGSYPCSIIYCLCCMVTNLILTTILVARLHTISLPPFIERKMEEEEVK